MNEPHVLNFVACESLRMVKKQSLCQLQHGAQGWRGERNSTSVFKIENTAVAEPS